MLESKVCIGMRKFYFPFQPKFMTFKILLQLLESVLNKVVEEFEHRMSSQIQQVCLEMIALDTTLFPFFHFSGVSLDNFFHYEKLIGTCIYMNSIC